MKNMTNVIGQADAVSYFMREASNLEDKNQPLPFLGMYDEPGLGKSHIVTEFGAILPADITFLSINCKGTLNVTDPASRDYFDTVSAALAEGKRAIIHLDEFANPTAKGSLQDWFSSHISKYADGTCLPIRGGDPLPMNTRTLGFIATSFCPQRAAVDIKDRLPQPAGTVLSAYTVEELTAINRLAIRKEFLEASMPLPRMTDAALRMVARSMRGNARQADKVAEEIRKAAKAAPGFHLTLETAEAVMKTVGVLPHGLSGDEAKIISQLTVSEKGTDTLKTKTGVSGTHWSKAINYLQDGTGKGAPFQLCNADGDPVEGAAGSLIDYSKGKYFLTRHGLTVAAILKKKGWID
jgi:hypothetical protein